MCVRGVLRGLVRHWQCERVWGGEGEVLTLEQIGEAQALCVCVWGGGSLRRSVTNLVRV